MSEHPKRGLWFQSQVQEARPAGNPHIRSFWRLLRVALGLMRKSVILFVFLPFSLNFCIWANHVYLKNKLLNYILVAIILIGIYFWIISAQISWIRHRAQDSHISAGEALNTGGGYWSNVGSIYLRIFVYSLPALILLFIGYYLTKSAFTLSEGLHWQEAFMGFLFLVVAGWTFYLQLIYCFAPIVVVFEHQGGKAACDESRFLSLGARWRIARIWLLIRVTSLVGFHLIRTYPPVRSAYSFTDALQGLAPTVQYSFEESVGVIVLWVGTSTLLESIAMIFAVLLYAEQKLVYGGWSCYAPIGFDNQPRRPNAAVSDTSTTIM